MTLRGSSHWRLPPAPGEDSTSPAARKARLKELDAAAAKNGRKRPQSRYTHRAYVTHRARRSFRTSYCGDVITVSAGELIHGSHEIVERHPEEFALVTGRSSRGSRMVTR